MSTKGKKKKYREQPTEIKRSWMTEYASPDNAVPSWEPGVRVDELRPTDVLCGRGNTATVHGGNVRYRELVKQLQDTYNRTPKVEKYLIAVQIIRAVQSSDPPGRFLVPDNENNTGAFTSHYLTVHPRRAIEKTLQGLRETRWTHCNNLKRRNWDIPEDLSNSNNQQHLVLPPQPPSPSAAAAGAAAAGAAATAEGSQPLRHPPAPKDERQKQPIISRVAVGTRVGIWWEDDECYYDATCIFDDEGKGNYWRKLLYDDGEIEWLDLREHRFRILSPSSALVGKKRGAGSSGAHYASNAKKKKLKRNDGKDEEEDHTARTPPKSYLLYPQPSFLTVKEPDSILAACCEYLGLGEYVNADLLKVQVGGGSFEEYLKQKRRGSTVYEHYPKLAVVHKLAELAREKVTAAEDADSELRQVLEQFDKVRIEQKDRYDFWGFCRTFVENKGKLPPPPPQRPRQEQKPPPQFQHPLFAKHSPGGGGGGGGLGGGGERNGHSSDAASTGSITVPSNSRTSSGFSYLNAPSAPGSNDSSNNNNATISHRLLEGSSLDVDNQEDTANDECNMYEASQEDDGDYDDNENIEEKRANVRALREARERYELHVAARKENLRMLALEAEMKEAEETANTGHRHLLQLNNGGLNEGQTCCDGDNEVLVDNVEDVMHTTRAVILVTGLLLKTYRPFALLTIYALGGTGVLERLLAPTNAVWRRPKKNSKEPIHPSNTTTGLKTMECFYKDLALVLVTIALQVMNAPDSYLALIGSVTCFSSFLTCASYLIRSLRNNRGGMETLCTYGSLSVAAVSFYGLAISLWHMQEMIQIE